MLLIESKRVEKKKNEKKKERKTKKQKMMLTRSSENLRYVSFCRDRLFDYFPFGVNKLKVLIVLTAN